jgi:hypothetical protein
VAEPDPRVLGGGVLADVGQALRDREVDRGLDRCRRPAGELGIDPHRHRHVESKRLHGSAESTVGEHRRVDAAHYGAQLAERGVGGLPGVVDQLAGCVGVLLHDRVGHPEAE